jgi:hypothetical protein
MAFPVTLWNQLSITGLRFKLGSRFQVFIKARFFQIKIHLKGQSHEKVYEFLTWDGSFSLNYGSPTLFKILKSPV